MTVEIAGVLRSRLISPFAISPAPLRFSESAGSGYYLEN
jgi:hypothetical protein